MPPALHPRSSTTLTLFTSTLAISFLVVGLPHIIPCPAPPQACADDGTPMNRRRRKPTMLERIGKDIDEVMKEEYEVEKGRECPVPKPGGLVGKMLGVKTGNSPEAMAVRVDRFDPMTRRIRTELGDGKG